MKKSEVEVTEMRSYMWMCNSKDVKLHTRLSLKSTTRTFLFENFLFITWPTIFAVVHDGMPYRNVHILQRRTWIELKWFEVGTYPFEKPHEFKIGNLNPKRGENILL